MIIVSASVIIFVVTLGAALVGLAVHKTLPTEQKSDSARSMVGQVGGLVSLLLALVLGTLIGTSFGSFGTQKANLEMLSAQLLNLDQTLAQYGPETKPLRDKLKENVQKAYDTFWGGGDADPAQLSVSAPLAAGQATKAFLAGLTPTTDVQKQTLAAANAAVDRFQQQRILLSLQVASHPVSPGLVIVLVIWAVVLFFSMGLFVEANGLVLSAATFGAMCVAFAVFLLLELGRPYTGLFRVSPAPLQEVIENIDK
jgi:hypothetical protein